MPRRGDVRIYLYYDVSGYPFKIAPMFRVAHGVSFGFEHLIIDSGVNRFFKLERRKDYPRIAIGTLCTRARLEYALECCKIARIYSPESWIHVFGPNIRWLRHIAPYIDSIDSVSYYKPPSGAKHRYTTNVRSEWIKLWLDKAERYLAPWIGQETLD